LLARSRSLPGAALAFVLLFGALTSCTLTRTSVDECKTNDDCRTSFGVGKVCGAGGLCDSAPPNPRCTTTFPADVLTRPENYKNVILLGSMMDHSIPGQIAREQAILLATTQVNEQGGIDGRLFGMIFCDIAENANFDSLKRTDAAVASGRYLNSVMGVHAIVGPSSSTDALAVYDAVKTVDTVVISPSATSPALTAADPAPSDDAPGRLWRTAPPDTLQGVAIVRYIRTTFPEVKSVALVQEKGAYGDALAQIFTAGFQQAGGAVTPFVFANSGERDAAIVGAGDLKLPFVLFFSSQSKDSVAFLTAAQALPSYASTRFFLTDASATTDLLNGAAGAAALFPRVVGSRPAVPQGPTFDLFKVSFNGAFQKDPTSLSFVSHSYDAAWLAFYGTAYALRREGRVTGTGIARGLRKLSTGAPEVAATPSNWKTITDAIGGGATVNIIGASGSLDYDPANEETTGLVNIWKISDDGKAIESLATVDPR
jgi:ABC-type branched-subunit amino acid transport system substrate-binding protein